MPSYNISNEKKHTVDGVTTQPILQFISESVTLSVCLFASLSFCLSVSCPLQSCFSSSRWEFQRLKKRWKRTFFFSTLQSFLSLLQLHVCPWVNKTCEKSFYDDNKLFSCFLRREGRGGGDWWRLNPQDLCVRNETMVWDCIWQQIPSC